MPNPQNIVDFKMKKGETLNPNGRPRKFVTTLKAQGHRQSEINDTIQVLLSQTLDELQEVYENPKSTVLEKVIANAIRTSIKKGDLKNIESVLNRAFGFPTQQIEQKTEEMSKPPSWFDEKQ